MLVQYAVENYRSIKDEVVINFRVNERYRDTEWAIHSSDISAPLYKCVGLIGPNASGKTNIIRSFKFAIRFILDTIKRRDGAKINIEKFAFDKKMAGEPTSFEFVFYRDGIKYVYGFSVDAQEVREEYLEGYFSKEPKVLFERYEGQHFEFGDTDVKVQREIAEKTNPNRLYMPVAAEWGYAPLKEVYQWFVSYPGGGGDLNIRSLIDGILQEDKKKIFIRELQRADFNIKDIYIKKKKIDKKSYDILERFLDTMNMLNEDSTIDDFVLDIRVIHQDYKGETYEVALDEDSAGTESFVENISELLYMSGQGGLMVEDELGKSYHTRLMQHFLGMFRSSVINPGHAQLLFTTHNTKILDIVNPDQVYLVDKDETGATVVKLLDDYLIREDDDIELGYLKGRYGGVPYTKG